VLRIGLRSQQRRSLLCPLACRSTTHITGTRRAARAMLLQSTCANRAAYCRPAANAHQRSPLTSELCTPRFFVTAWELSDCLKHSQTVGIAFKSFRRSAHRDAVAFAWTEMVRTTTSSRATATPGVRNTRFYPFDHLSRARCDRGQIGKCLPFSLSRSVR
jgi:hypothetical protein